MTHLIDMGERVMITARTVTPAQAAELLAIRFANMHPTQCPTHPVHWRPGGACHTLQRAKLITAERVPGWCGRGWKRARLTELGERVLLHIAEEAMIATGRMTPLSNDDCEAA